MALRPLPTRGTDWLPWAEELVTEVESVGQTTYTAAHTLVLANAGNIVEIDAAGVTTLTVPTNATAAFPVGTVIGLRQYGAGQVTVAPAAGVTIRSRGAALKTAAQYAEASLFKRAADEWILTGDVVV